MDMMYWTRFDTTSVYGLVKKKVNEEEKMDN
jgi:hypothetical protein